MGFYNGFQACSPEYCAQGLVRRMRSNMSLLFGKPHLAGTFEKCYLHFCIGENIFRRSCMA